MILVTLSVVPLPERHEEMVAVFWMLLGPTRVEPGCLRCELHEEIGDGGTLLYLEEWETPEQLERHMRSARYERLLAVMEASARPPVLRYHTVACSKGMEYLQAVRLGAAACTPPPGKAATKDRP